MAKQVNQTTAKQNTSSILKRFQPYMGDKAPIFPWALILSGVSAFFAILPLLFTWKLIRIVLQNLDNFSFSLVSSLITAIAVSSVIAVISYFIALLLSHICAFRVEAGLQRLALRKIMSKPLGFFDNEDSGRIRKVINDGAATTHSFIAHQLPDLAGSIVTPLLMTATIFLVNWRLGLVSLLPLIIAFSVAASMTSKTSNKFMEQYMLALESMSAESVEYVRGMSVLKTFGQSVHSLKRFYNSIINYKDMVLEYTLLWRHKMSIYYVALESIALFILPLAILLISNNDPSIIITDYIFYLMLSPLFGSIIMRSMYMQRTKQIAEMALDKVEAYINAESLIYPPNSQAFTADSIEFKNVSFAYPGAKENAISDISFKLNKGETVALVGASGSGKTTIARLAARFWDASSGSILIGGTNIKDITQEDLMSSISFVFQNTKLFSKSLRDNITLGREYSDAEITRAIELSQSTDIIAEQTNGLESVIGTEGTYLSGGEQQRISLARAILKDSDIILLDEATAFADPENEHLIQKALLQVRKNKTTLMIAHRLTSITDVDRILVVDDGKIVEAGTHNELFEKDGLYTKMYKEYLSSVNWNIKTLHKQEKKA